MKTETKDSTHAERRERKLEGGDLIEAEERLSVAGTLKRTPDIQFPKKNRL